MWLSPINGTKYAHPATATTARSATSEFRVNGLTAGAEEAELDEPAATLGLSEELLPGDFAEFSIVCSVYVKISVGPIRSAHSVPLGVKNTPSKRQLFVASD